jgi:glutamine synthetase
MMTDWHAVREKLAAENIEGVDLRLTDLVGEWRQISLSTAAFETLMEDAAPGLMIDGTAIPGWRDVTDADLVLQPRPERAFADPYTARPSLAVFAEAVEPGTGLDYERDPRSLVRRLVAHLREQSIADDVQVSLETGFHLVERAEIDVGRGRCSVRMVDPSIPASDRATHPLSMPLSGQDTNFPAMMSPPRDTNLDIRAEIASHLAMIGLPDIQHRAGAGLALNELAVPAAPVEAACDAVQMIRFVARQVAASYGRTATFLPCPIPAALNDRMAGAGLAARIALWKDGKPLFAGNGYADLSATCMHFIGGILEHGRALNALTNATTNSYRRLRSSRDAPNLFAYAAHNRSAAIRIPYASTPEGKCVELAFADPAANPYLALPAMIMAGLDGIRRRIEPGDAVDRNLYDLKPELHQQIPPMCRSLDEALTALEADHGFLLAGDVFSEDLIDAYIEIKRQEIERIERVPHPAELALNW